MAAQPTYRSVGDQNGDFPGYYRLAGSSTALIEGVEDEGDLA